MSQAPAQKESGQFGKGWVVGIGASAGGLEALTLLISDLSADFQGTIIIAQHLAPKAKSMMVELLSRHSALPILSATNDQKLAPATIYIVPPNHDVEVKDGKIFLIVAGPETRPKPSIDDFFTSLAKAYGPRALGIILSGTGSDGAQGIQTLHRIGGLTIAQDAGSAKYDGMPRAAVDTGEVDSILSPEQIAKTLKEILTEKPTAPTPPNVDAKVFERILTLLKKRHHADFSGYRFSTLHRRLIRRLNQLEMPDLEAYLDRLEKVPGEVAQLSQDFLVSVTEFFRDKEAFEILKAQISEMLMAKSPGQEFRIWVAGCATGEEAYSIAMLLADLQDRLGRIVSVKIFATDLDHDALVEARQGVYTTEEVKKLPKSYLNQFFQPHGQGRFEVVQRIRDYVVFARQDLVQNPPFVKLDLVTCRNVLIYFEPELQKRVLETFHYSLIPSGRLFLGKSESLGTSGNLFTILDKKNKIYEKLNVVLNLQSHGRAASWASATHAPLFKRREDEGFSLAEKAYTALLETQETSAVVVDEDGHISQILGDVSKQIGFFSQNVDFRLPNLVPKAMGVEISLLIRRVTQQGGTHRSRWHLQSDGESALQVTVRHLDQDRPGSLFLVIFKKRQQEKIAKPVKLDETFPSRFQELEQELHLTREHLQTVIEELGVSNEELQSLNEELSSTNEELQASNEELETTNEELQSTNEEMTTVNEELAVKTTELRFSNANLENIQRSIGSPLLVVDRNLNLLRYNQEALKIFAIDAPDLGRQITRLSARCELPDFESNLHTVIKEEITIEKFCEVGNSYYQLRILPCYDDRRNIVGAIVIFFDDTAAQRAQNLLAESEKRTREIIDSSSSLISLKDNLGRYVLVNEAFAQFFGLDRKKIVGRTDRELFPEMVARHFRDADLEVLLQRTSRRREEDFKNKEGEVTTVLVNRFPLSQEHQGEPYAVGTIAIDISAQVQAQRALQESESRYKAIVEEQAVFVCRHQPDGRLIFANSIFLAQWSPQNPGAELPSLFDWIWPEDKVRMTSALAAIDADNPIAQDEYRFRRTDKAIRWVRWIHRGVFSATGQLVEFQAVGFDVTDYRRQQDDLIQKDAIFKGVFSNTSDFITVYRLVGKDFILESLNRTAELVLGQTASQLLGRKLQEVRAGRSLTETLEHYKSVMAQAHPQIFEEEFLIEGRRLHFSTTLVPIQGPNGEIERIAALSRDISAAKNIETDLRRAKDSAEVANRAKSDFLASMSHELRTPLNVVLGMAHLLEETKLEKEQVNFVRSIHRSGKILLALIEDVLDISKIESGKIQIDAIPFQLTALIDEVIEVFAVQAEEKGLQLVTTIHRDADQYVIGDPARLRQVIVNLIGNAIKFTDSGRIELIVKTEGFEQAGEQTFSISVKDSGIGIKREDQQKIFQKFSQVESGHSRRFGGSGLGLVISKHLVHLMHGEIDFESAPGIGSHFWFTVRMVLTTQEEIENRRRQLAFQARAARSKSKKLKVLAVDDNQESQHVVRLFLNKLGHEVAVASSGSESLEALEKNRFDLVLMDVQMPGMDGLETTRKIRQKEGPIAKVPIIALTANVMSGDAERCLESGMDDYLSKPLKIESLKDMLNRWANRMQND